ncbi:ATP-binding protein [Carboxylicivirga sp. RSCT41]|uniref:sensor histidine kinase n=1 Tax=Carboxylicivirga agarovorans TaxID=3417570 RepID=UPI003D34D649
MENILLIDDDKETLRLYELIFRNLYILKYANACEKAIEIIRSEKIKIVIVENIIRNASITDLFSQLRLNFPFLKIILVSNIHDHHLIQDAVNKYGIYSYFVKPIEPHRIQVATERAFEQYNLEYQQQKLILSLRKKTDSLKKTVKQLRQEEEKFRSIYETRPEPTFIVDNNGHILRYNPGALNTFPGLKECGSNELLINCFSGSAVKKLSAYFDLLLRGETANTCEIECEVSDEKVIFDISAFKFEYRDTEAFLLTFRDISLKKEMEKRVLTSIINTEEKERRRFAQELHDGIGPLLSTTKLYLQWFNKPDSKADKEEVIRKAEETLEETISSLREISNNISPNTLNNFGLDTALKTFLDRIRNASGIKVNYHMMVRKQLITEVETTLYRLLCECVNNTIKHANASQIDITIKEANNGVNLCYKDNGIGFDFDNMVMNGQGNGLFNMKSRVNSLGGSFDLRSRKGHGVVMSVKF